MAYIGTTEVIALQGELPHEYLPIAASQVMVPGDFVYLNGGLVTRLAASTVAINSDQPAFGIIDQMSTHYVEGVATSIAAGSLVKVIPFTRNVVLNLPSYGGTPVITNLCSSTNSTGFAMINDGGIYKIDLGNTSKAVVRPYSFDYLDSRKGNGVPQFKATWVVGDRMRCVMLAAGLQVIL